MAASSNLDLIILRILIALKTHQRRQAAEHQATSTPTKAGTRLCPVPVQQRRPAQDIADTIGHRSTYVFEKCCGA